MMADVTDIATKELEIDGCVYIFDTLEELVNILKDEDYECMLTMRKKGKLKRIGIKL